MKCLTAIGLTAGGSSTVKTNRIQYTEQHNETEYLERNIYNNKNTQVIVAQIEIEANIHINIYTMM